MVEISYLDKKNPIQINEPDSLSEMLLLIWLKALFNFVDDSFKSFWVIHC